MKTSRKKTMVEDKKSSIKMVALNFRVSPQFKKDFKVTAAQYGVTQSDLLKLAFEEWQTTHINK